MYTRSDIITEERLAHLAQIREAKREEGYRSLIPLMGEEAAYALKEIYDLFTIDMLIWYAGLWEPEIGGFYFSNSARDTEGLLPDLESTEQAMRFIASNGCGHIPERFRLKAGQFAYNLQDEDGYFYHPQWGKKIGVSRRGRDYGWGIALLKGAGMTPKYRLPTERKGSDEAATLPEYLQSVEAWRAYLESQPITEKSYPVGNLINAQAQQIKGAGPEFVAALVEWVNKNQRADNGLWEPQINYASVNGLMKLNLTYSIFGEVMPHTERAMESALQAAMSDEKITFCCQFYNPWSAISGLLSGMEKLGERGKAASLREKLLENAAEVIRVTGRKIRTTRCDDGSFAYHAADSGNTCPCSQGALVALGVREGDINGNGCSISGPLNGMFSALGVPKLPIFTEEDGAFLFELMDARVPAPKIYELPEDKKRRIIFPDK